MIEPAPIHTAPARSDVEVRPARGRLFAGFMDLPYRLHADLPYWAPPLRFDVAGRLKKNHPYFEHGEAEIFVAVRAGQVVGRIGATVNRLHNQEHKDTVGFFGFFECEDRQSTADALLAAASDWLRARGMTVIRGPMSFSVNDELGMLVEGFDSLAASLMPFNPPYYNKLMTGAGFVKAKDLYMLRAYDSALRKDDRLQRIHERVKQRRKLTFRQVDMSRFDDDVKILKEIYNEAWRLNWGHVPMTDAEISKLAADMKMIVDPRLIAFCFVEGEAAGVSIGLPNLNELLVKNPGGRLFPTGLLKLLWGLKVKRTNGFRLAVLGVKERFRGAGIPSAFILETVQRGLAAGYSYCDCGWTLEDNDDVNNYARAMGAETSQTYRIYDRAV